MIFKLLLLLTGSLSLFALYVVMALLFAMSTENELPDLSDIEV
jgi:hypothetical protein